MKNSYISSLILLCSLFFSSVQAQVQTVGLFQNSEAAYDGYTLFAPTIAKTTYLIDNCGKIVNTWESDYNPGMVAYLMDNGNLLRAVRITGSIGGGGSGGRLEMFDWDGNLIWSYNHVSSTVHQHHDIEILPNGNILILAWEAHTTQEAIDAGISPSQVGSAIFAEQIIEIEPVGIDGVNVVWEWHLWDHLVQEMDSTKLNYGVVAEHPELMNINYRSNGSPDWIHLNAIDYNPELDQIILSSRNLSEFWVIDHSTTSAEAATHLGGNSGKGGDIIYRWGNPKVYNRGTDADQKLFGQHDVHWIPAELPDAGKIMIFNNGTGRPGGSYSSVDIISPPVDADGNYSLDANEKYAPVELEWSYSNPSEFYSPRISGAQRLPNGNTLICNGNAGHLFEINPAKEIVWDYINPLAAGIPVVQGSNFFNQNDIFRAYRYAADFQGFTGKNLNPTVPIEANPLPSDCMTYPEFTPTNQLDLTTLSSVSIQTNPFQNELIINNETGENIAIQIVDYTGRIVLATNTNSHNAHLDTSSLAKGFYVVHITNKNKSRFFIQKVLKF